MKEIYDVIIIGCGPAGITAGIFCARYGLNTLIIEKGIPGGKLNVISEIDNYPGFPEISGQELSRKMVEHLKRFNVDIIYPEEVVDLKVKDEVKRVMTRSGKEFKSYSIIIATGAEKKKAKIKGEEKFLGRGVSYCATCDGYFFKGKNVAVIGNKQEAAKEALFLSGIAKKVYIIPNGDIDMPEYDLRKLEEMENVEILKNAYAVEILGENVVNGLKIRIGNEEKTLNVNGIFIALGSVPIIDIFKKAGIRTDERGCIIVDNKQRTNIEGIFAAGDCTCRGFQVIVACGDAAVAAMEANLYVRKVKRKT